jgi:hypothetical protein
MPQAEHDHVHRYLPLEDQPSRIEQDQAGQQPQDQVPIIGVFALYLARRLSWGPSVILRADGASAVNTKSLYGKTAAARGIPRLLF